MRKSQTTTLALLAIGTAALLTACFDAGQAPAHEAEAATTDLQPRIDAAEKAGTEKPVLEKFIHIPNIGESEQVPRLQTTDGEYEFVDGGWRLAAPALAKSNIQRFLDGSITDIKVTSGTTSGAACPSGYYKIDADLNRRAGGRWVFLCVKGGDASQSIDAQSIDIVSQSSYGAGPGQMKGVNGSNGDMNQGAGGQYVFGNYSLVNRGGHCRLAGLGVTTDPVYAWMLQSVPAPWWIMDVTDINDGAGGDFIYILGKYTDLTAYNDCARYH
jgi:hypothetical protein